MKQCEYDNHCSLFNGVAACWGTLSSTELTCSDLFNSYYCSLTPCVICYFTLHSLNAIGAPPLKWIWWMVNTCIHQYSLCGTSLSPLFFFFFFNTFSYCRFVEILWRTWIHAFINKEIIFGLKLQQLILSHNFQVNTFSNFKIWFWP